MKFGVEKVEGSMRGHRGGAIGDGLAEEIVRLNFSMKGGGGEGKAGGVSCCVGQENRA